MKYNKEFELDLDDIDLIEHALRFCMKNNSHLDNKEINELLGRLHNQKKWYRPSKGTYISG